MKFLIDAQLPRRLTKVFQEAGHSVIHTLDLPQKNATQDWEINRISMEQNYIVVTKDKDFWHSFLLSQQPYKLLLVTTGNINNNDLIALFQKNLAEIAELFNQHDVIEISQDQIVVY
jgi:predicted nuclease of predicted toxin-antitoxin system